jgi:ADP-heptose:LPS heptosyltransferase
MLKATYPNAKLVVGISSWHENILSNNPYIDQIIRISAPWHNQFADNKGVLQKFFYLFSKEVRQLRSFNFDLGIDVVGSHWGSLLLLLSNCKTRIGVEGYAGGHTANHKNIIFKLDRHITDAAIEQGIIAGCKRYRTKRPQIFLTEEESNQAFFKDISSDFKNIVLAPGCSFEEKSWGNNNFTQLARLLINTKDFQVIVVGSKLDRHKISLPSSEKFESLCGNLSLRESASLVSQADFVITNSSLCMHLAGAFSKPSLTLLGSFFDSAKLHHKQWGYPEGIVLGKEITEGRSEVISVEEAYKTVCNSLKYNF